MSNNNNNNDEDIRGKKSPEIEVDPITGKITVKETDEQDASISSNKDSQQSRKKMIEPHHAPDEPALEEKEKRKNIFLNLSQRILGNQSRNINKKNLDVAQNIGERMNKMGIKFMGHISASKSSQLSPETPLTGKTQTPDKGNDRNI